MENPSACQALRLPGTCLQCLVCIKDRVLITLWKEENYLLVQSMTCLSEEQCAEQLDACSGGAAVGSALTWLFI